MSKWLVGVLLLANVLFFSFMNWGSTLLDDAGTVGVQPEIRPSSMTLANPPTSNPVPSTPMPPASKLASELTPVTSEPLQCVEWGEFSGAMQSRAQALLAELHLGARLTQRVVEYDSGFWVFMPPLKNHAEVQRKIEQLKKRGVKEYFVVQEESEWANAISLGVFKSEDSARKLLADLRQKGVHSAKMGERKSHLKFIVFLAKEMEPPLVDKFRAFQQELPDSELKIRNCN